MGKKLIDRFLIGAMVIVNLLNSCINDSLDGCEPKGKLVRFEVDWSKFDKEVPTGMTLRVFPMNGGKPREVLTNDISSADFSLPPGRYSAFVFNQSASEFGTLEFRNMDSFETAEVIVLMEKLESTKERYGEQRIAMEPEWLAVGRVADFKVDEDKDTTIIPMVPLNVVCKTTVKASLSGIYNLRSVRGTMTGMASTYLLGKDSLTMDTVTYAMNKWTKKVDQTDATKGVVSSYFYSFGLPSEHKDEPLQNLLNISTLLVDNKTQKDYRFEVGNRFEYGDDPMDDSSFGAHNITLNVSVKVPESLPDVKPAEDKTSGGGFDVDVEKWGDPIDIDVNI